MGIQLKWNDEANDLGRNVSSGPSPADAPDTDTSSETSDSNNTTTETMSTSFTDPVAELRDRAGASSDATGSEVLASGGGVLEATQTLRGLRDSYDSGTDQLGAARRLIESDATDAPSDIITKMDGSPDPNPGHTTPTDANSPVTRTVNAAEATAQQARQLFPSLPVGGDDRGFLALVAAAVLGLLALLAGATGGTSG